MRILMIYIAVLCTILVCADAPQDSKVDYFPPLSKTPSKKAIVDSTANYIFRRLKDIPEDKAGRISKSDAIRTLKVMIDNNYMLK